MSFHKLLQRYVMTEETLHLLKLRRTGILLFLNRHLFQIKRFFKFWKLLTQKNFQAHWKRVKTQPHNRELIRNYMKHKDSNYIVTYIHFVPRIGCHMDMLFLAGWKFAKFDLRFFYVHCRGVVREWQRGPNALFKISAKSCVFITLKEKLNFNTTSELRIPSARKP